MEKYGKLLFSSFTEILCFVHVVYIIYISLLKMNGYIDNGLLIGVAFTCMLDSFCQLGQSLSCFFVALTVVPKTDHKQRDYLLTSTYSSNVYHSCTFWLYNLCSTNAVTSHDFCLIVATGLRHMT